MTAPKSPSRAEETAQKIKLVRGLLDKCVPIGDIKWRFADHFHCTPRAAERFITLCYEMMRLDSDKSTEDHRADAYRTYKRIIADPKATCSDKIRAQEGLDKITGVRAAIKIDSSGSIDIKKPPEMSHEEVQSEIDNLMRKTIEQSDLVEGGDETPTTGD